MLHALPIAAACILLVLALSQRVVAAAASATPTSPAADSVNSFACDLYGILSADRADENIFFSPFSMSCALAMTAEGARGQTADEMGHALRLGTASRTDDVARPWDLSSLHAGLGALSDRLGPKPVPQEVRDRIASARAELAAANKKLESDRRYDESTEKLHGKAEQLAVDLNVLLAQVDQYEFRAANALWGEKTFDFQQAFLDTLAKFYKTGGLFQLDFRGDPEGSRTQINHWVSDQTRDRINDLIKPGQIQPDTRLVLTNAVYFKGEWSDPFEGDQTKEDDFTTVDGKKLRVPLMHKWNPAGAKYAAFDGDGSLFATPDMVPMANVDREKSYPAAAGFLIAELAYKGGDLAMTLIVPQSASGLKDLRSKLSAANVAAWVGARARCKLEVFLPKFKLETDYDMVNPLAAMGMKRAFVNPINADGAEFDGISPSADPARRLFVGAVVHRAFVDVNEKGTEAAAATAVMMRAGAAPLRQVPFIPTIRVDRPFILLIRETSTGTILFMGQVTKPVGT